MPIFLSSYHELAKTLGDTRIALTNGCYDVIHSGHITFLKQFRNMLSTKGLNLLASVAPKQVHLPLVVAINSDASVAKLKGPGRPINSACDRATVLAALRVVDTVVVFEEESPLEIIKTLNPLIIAKGGDYADVKIVGEDFVLSNGGQVFKGPYLNGYSSTEILNRCKDTSPVGLN